MYQSEPKELLNTYVPLSNAAALLTVPASTKYLVKTVRLLNTSGSLTQTVTLWKTKSEDSNAISNKRKFEVVELSPNQPHEVVLSMMMEEGDAIHASTTTGSTVALFIWGAELTAL